MKLYFYDSIYSERKKKTKERKENKNEVSFVLHFTKTLPFTSTFASRSSIKVLNKIIIQNAILSSKQEKCAEKNC